MAKASFVLVRHGQTAWNVEGRYQGQADIPLDETGLEQAAHVAKVLAKQRFDAVISSDLARARVTAERIASALGLKLRVDKRLREIDLGEWEGQLFTDIAHRYPELIKHRVEDPLHMRPPGGESLEECASRVFSAMDDLTLHYPMKRVLVVSHGVVVSVIWLTASGQALDAAYQHIPANAVPIEIQWNIDGR